MIGWIKVDRKIQSNALWMDREPFDKRSAWIDLLLMANHKDHEIIHKGKTILVRRGEVNRSVLQLCDRWHWSRNRTLRFLKMLSDANMITRVSTTDGTTVCIKNYDKYQFSDTTSDTTKSIGKYKRKAKRKTTHDTTDGTTHDTTGDTTDGTHTINKECINKSIMIDNDFHYETNADRAGMTLKDFIKAKAKGEIG